VEPAGSGLVAAAPGEPSCGVPTGVRAGESPGEQAFYLRDGERDHAGVGRWCLAGREGRWDLGIGAVPELRGGHGADGQGGHDQHGVAQDRGVQPGLALVQAQALGDTAIVKGQLTCAQVTAHQQVMPRRGGGDPGPGIPPLALGALAS
jgi:hypothetical protein